MHYFPWEETGGKKRAERKGREEKGEKKWAGRNGREEKGGKTRHSAYKRSIDTPWQAAQQANLEGRESFIPMDGGQGWEISRGGVSRRCRWCSRPTASSEAPPQKNFPASP